jgi:hypothetical protein
MNQHRLFPGTPMLVHVFPAGGDRARHLTLEKIAQFRDVAIPQKATTPIAGPNFDNRIWWLDGWKVLP